MKRILCLCVSVLLVFSMAGQACAQEVSDDIVYTPILANGEPSPGGSFAKADVKLSPVCSDEDTYSIYATRYFSFDGLAYQNITSDWVEYEVQQGDSVYVDVTSCSWYPHTCNIEVGIFNVSDPDSMCEILSGGNYSDPLVFGDVDAGTYVVYVRNLSKSTITDGSIRYSIS